jgi:hypothetical protein
MGRRRRRGPGGSARRRPPARYHQPIHTTLPPLLRADLAARAAAAAAAGGPRKDRTIAGQIVRCCQRAAGRDYVLAGELEAIAGVVLGALARLRERWRLPADAAELATADRAVRRLARVGRDMRGGQG